MRQLVRERLVVHRDVDLGGLASRVGKSGLVFAQRNSRQQDAEESIKATLSPRSSIEKSLFGIEPLTVLLVNADDGRRVQLREVCLERCQNRVLRCLSTGGTDLSFHHREVIRRMVDGGQQLGIVPVSSATEIDTAIMTRFNQN